jgi:hypothetical protein
MSRCVRLALVALGGMVLALTGWTDPSAAQPPLQPSRSFAVGVETETFVDHSRVTPADGQKPELPERT